LNDEIPSQSQGVSTLMQVNEERCGAAACCGKSAGRDFRLPANTTKARESLPRF
jgi:hypothetical protein